MPQTKWLLSLVRFFFFFFFFLPHLFLLLLLLFACGSQSSRAGTGAQICCRFFWMYALSTPAVVAARCQKKLPACCACATCRSQFKAWWWYAKKHKNTKKRRKKKESRKIDMRLFSRWVSNAAYFCPNGEGLCSHANQVGVGGVGVLKSRCEWAGVFTVMPSVGAYVCVQYVSVCVWEFTALLSSEMYFFGSRGWVILKTL